MLLIPFNQLRGKIEYKRNRKESSDKILLFSTERSENKKEIT